MSMKQNEPITIRQLANGFGIWPEYSATAETTPAYESRYVFQTMEGLIDFLKGHFTHRESFVPVDDSINLAKGNK
jgi:hypothetical protein